MFFILGWTACSILSGANASHPSGMTFFFFHFLITVGDSLSLPFLGLRLVVYAG